MPYRSLNPDLIVQTTSRLSDRMEARFGGRGLTSVAKELKKFAQEEVGRAKRIARPRILVRSLAYLCIASGIAVIAYIVWTVKIDFQAPPSFDMFEGVEAFINLLILLSAGIWFLLNLEARMKRHDVLVRINQLRSIAHVIDMHQLSKDPMPDLHSGVESESLPESDLHGYDLIRYLDYCADLLALTGKLASVYLEYIEDPIVIASVNDFESLTGELSRKIWQKVTVLELQGGFQMQAGTANGMAGETDERGPPEQLPLELPDFLK
ncbi:MAG: hypothetical protein AAGL99_14575 [Pseudomonadota bacterium]